jgi:hypothetical protein
MIQKAKIAAVAVLAVALGGCVISSGHKRGPNGLPMYFLDGMTASAALKKAEKLCPSGYKTIGTPKQTSALDFVMTIECKQPGGEPVALQATPPPPPAGFLVPLPEIDIAAHCRDPRVNSGSALIQVNCLETEPPARLWLESRYTTSAIAVFCGRIAQSSQSYFLTKNCVEQEEIAKAKLPPERSADTPAQSNSSWWEKQKTPTTP